jgi:hypothetical protein
MNPLLKKIRVKTVVLLGLILLSVSLWTQPFSVKANCEECVALTGGLCVGCASDPNGHTRCTPDQSTCTCNVSADRCSGGTD